MEASQGNKRMVVVGRRKPAIKSKKLLYQEFTTCEFPVDLMAVAVASSVEVFD
ncbi:hypothetical protein F2Q69_00007631 [Brassica cretica]|uniref:Uncharacterized protein n=1 Tax=Brassica cretica TaxID=69181 RepID=A0A8S9NMD7_BRACR|nr:hypothetical protein F2Q69_00007631 [Brassica cretica]